MIRIINVNILPWPTNQAVCEAVHNHFMSFRVYLSQLRSIDHTQVRHFVVGNSSADYDSFFGSILLGYFLSITTQHIHLPIIDCLESELPLRFEIMAVLQKMNIDFHMFTYEDTLTQLPPDAVVSLYDHNNRASLDFKVQYVVDHHAADLLQGRKQLITKMGSALTIVYYLMHPSAFLYHQSSSEFALKYSNFVEGEKFGKKDLSDQEVDEIIRYGIILDTFNLDEKNSDRWTEFDRRALHLIEETRSYDFGVAWLDQLKFNKTRNLQLSLKDSLKKDYKKLSYRGMLDVEYSIAYLQPVQFYERYKQQLKNEMPLGQQTGQVYIIMLVFKTDASYQVRRQMLVRYQNESEKVSQVFDKYLRQINLEKVGILGSEWYRWVDHSCVYSRKKIDATLRAYMQKLNPQ